VFSDNNQPIAQHAQTERDAKQVEQTEENIEKTTTHKTEEAVSYFLVGLFGATIISVLILLGIQKGKEMKIATYDQQIKTEVTDQLIALAPEKKQMETVLSQLDALTIALTSRVKYSSMMTDFENNTFKKSLWTNFSLSQNTISINGTADDYESAAKAAASYRNIKAVRDVKLTSATSNEESKKVDFVLSITFDSSLYKTTATKTAETSAVISPESTTQ